MNESINKAIKTQLAEAQGDSYRFPCPSRWRRGRRVAGIGIGSSAIQQESANGSGGWCAIVL